MDKMGNNPDFSWIRQSAAFLDVTSALKIRADESDEVASSTVGEFERRQSDLVRVATIFASLPIIKRRAKAYFIGKCQWPEDVAEELASLVLQKVFEALCGRWPHGNVGAWSVTITKRVGSDYQKKVIREREVLGRRCDAIEWDTHADSTTGREGMARLLIELPSVVRNIYDRRRRGDDWEIIEAETGFNEAGAAHLLRQVIDWPESGSPRARKRSRRKRSS